MWMTFYRTVILYIAVMIAMRIMGKRMIGELQPSELVVTIIISELAAIPMQDLERPIWDGFVAIITLVLLEVVSAYIIMHSNRLRHVVSGKPAVVIRDGVIDQRVMKKNRMTVDDLMETLRQANVFDLSEVAYAIVETNGKLSVQKRAVVEPVTPQQLKISAPQPGLSALLICDGVLQRYSLELVGFDEKKVRELLSSRRLEIKDVYLMTGSTAGDYVIIEKGKT